MSVDLSWSPETYWEGEDYLLTLIAALPDLDRARARKLCAANDPAGLKALFVRNRFVDRRGTLLPSCPGLEPDLVGARVKDLELEPVTLATLLVDGFPASLNRVEAQRRGWDIHYTLRSDDGMEEELDSALLPISGEDLVHMCSDLLQEIRSENEAYMEVDDMDGAWVWSSSVYPDASEYFEAEEAAWIEGVRQERAEDEDEQKEDEEGDGITTPA